MLRNRPRYTGPSEQTINVVLVRDGWCCVRCGENVHPYPYQIHHRRPRGMGGTSLSAGNYPSNLLTLCLPCHAYIESNRREAYSKGWLVGRHVADPSTIPCLVDHESAWKYLSSGYSDNPPGGEPA